MLFGLDVWWETMNLIVVALFYRIAKRLLTVGLHCFSFINHLTTHPFCPWPNLYGRMHSNSTLSLVHLRKGWSRLWLQHIWEWLSLVARSAVVTTTRQRACPHTPIDTGVLSMATCPLQAMKNPGWNPAQARSSMQLAIIVTAIYTNKTGSYKRKAHRGKHGT